MPVRDAIINHDMNRETNSNRSIEMSSDTIVTDDKHKTGKPKTGSNTNSQMPMNTNTKAAVDTIVEGFVNQTAADIHNEFLINTTTSK